MNPADLENLFQQLRIRKSQHICTSFSLSGERVSFCYRIIHTLSKVLSSMTYRNHSLYIYNRSHYTAHLLSIVNLIVLRSKKPNAKLQLTSRNMNRGFVSYIIVCTTLAFYRYETITC